MKFNLNKNQTKNLFFSVVGVLIILYFVYQIVQMNTNPYKTEIALERPVQSKITTQAFIVRDESYITATNTGGTIVSIAEDGKRVSSGDDVAVVFQDEGSAATYVRINELKKEIDYYKQLNNRVGLGVNAPSSYNKLIDDTCITFISATREKIGSDFDDALTDLRDAITTRQLAVGEKVSVEVKLAELEAELVSLNQKAVNYSTITSPNSGYYIGSVDGYEKSLGYSDVLNVDCNTISSLLASTPDTTPANIMGKLVDNFDWYFLCNIPYDESGKIDVGSTVKVNVPNTTVGTLKCSVVMKGNKDGDNVAVVLKCNIMNRDVANLRIHEIEIVTEDYVGIKIQNTAIREIDGQKVVYVKNGNIIQSKKINIVYSTEDFSIIEIVNDSAYVKQYDTIIIEGVDLSDGKVVS